MLTQFVCVYVHAHVSTHMWQTQSTYSLASWPFNAYHTIMD